MTSTLPHSNSFTPDRHHLHNVRRGFLSLNQARFSLAKETLSKKQQLFLDTLPALIHYNHPMLPGYVNHHTPAGLWNYKPSSETTEQLRHFSKSFQPRRHQPSHCDILSVFSMGSLGTIAQNSKSDIDLWLCHRPDLSAEELALLEKKTNSICQWAKTLDLDVTIFLMNHQLFNNKKTLRFNRESSGTTQHYLLLDEFYRTAIFLGGQLPAWIFVQSNNEADYQNIIKQINHQRLLPDQQHIDFGPIETIPASEFISSAIWQLYKAIDSPYKSILKLLLLEIYCREYPKLPLLSSLFKNQLHGVDRRQLLNLWDADPYLQTYHYIDRYLSSTGQSDRLDFLRRCFYFKLEQPLSQGSTTGKKSSVLLELVRQWDWGNDDIEFLDNPHRWTLDHILEERRLVVSELNHSYHFIMDFFRSQNSELQASNRELNILGRKLHAAFSRKSGKIDWFNPLHNYSISERSLRIKENKESHWIAVNSHGKVVAKRTHLMELLTWLHCNQVMTAQTSLYWQQSRQRSIQLNRLRKHLQSLIPVPLRAAEHQQFEHHCHLEKLIFLIDATTPTESHLSASDSHVKIDCISINNWREIICQSNHGELLKVLLPIFVTALQQEPTTFSASILCLHPDPKKQKLLQQQIDETLLPIIHFFKQQGAGRYLTRSNAQFCFIEINEHHATIDWLDNEQSIKEKLSYPQSHFSTVGIDEQLETYYPFSLFSQHNQSGSIQVFICQRGNEADITIIDETGCWHETTLPSTRVLLSLKPLHRFLRAINERRHGHSSLDIGPMDILPIHFYELVHNHDGWQTQALMINTQLDTTPSLPLFAVTEHNGSDYQFTVHSGDQRFSEMESGNRNYAQLANHIKQQLSSGKYQGWHINDMDLSPCRLLLSHGGELHTSHYLQMKRLLEKKIQRYL